MVVEHVLEPLVPGGGVVRKLFHDKVDEEDAGGTWSVFEVVFQIRLERLGICEDAIRCGICLVEVVGEEVDGVPGELVFRR